MVGLFKKKSLSEGNTCIITVKVYIYKEKNEIEFCFSQNNIVPTIESQ